MMTDTPDQGTRRRNALLAALIAALVALGAPAALIASGHNAGRAAWDSTVYHEPFIHQLARDWPRFDLSDPLTATTPGYHILLAAVACVCHDSTTVLRMGSALIGICLSALLAAWMARRTGWRQAILLTLPLSASIYVVSSNAWLLPDNLAWIGVLLVLILCIREPRSWRPLFCASAVLALLVLVRQIHLWAAAPIWLAAWMGTQSTDPGLFSKPDQRLRRAALAFFLTLPAFAIIAWFVWHWNGTTPPRFRTDITGINPATPAFILVQAAILWIGFSPWLAPALFRALRDRTALILLAGVAGLLLTIIPHTTHNPDAGRYSGWWILTAHAPVLFGRTSTAFILLAPLGAIALAGALIAIPRRAGWVILASLVAFAAAQSSTINSWQRYHEPFLLILLAMLSALQPPDLQRTPFSRFMVPAIAALTLMLSGITFLELRGTPVIPGTTPPPKHTTPADPWYLPNPTEPSDHPSESP